MNVKELLERREEFIGKEVTVSGLIIGQNDDVFLVEDTETNNDSRPEPFDTQQSIRVADEEPFGEKFIEAVPIRVGGYLYRKPATIVGMVGPSKVRPFPLEFSELTEVVVRAEGEEYRLNL